MSTVLALGTPPFAIIQRPVRTDKHWPGSGPLLPARLAGPIVIDVFNSLELTGDELVGRLIEEAEIAGVLLHGWTGDDVRAFRSSAWRSAHRFIVNNVHVVDRGAELDELAKLLGVDRR